MVKRILVAVLMLVGCEDHGRVYKPKVWGIWQPVLKVEHVAVPAEDVYDGEILDYAVMGAIEKQVDLRLTNYWGTDGFGLQEVKRRVEIEKGKIRCIQEWAMKLPNRQVADAYAKWTDYYLGRFDAVVRELQAHGEGVPTELEKIRSDIAKAKALEIPEPRICVGVKP